MSGIQRRTHGWRFALVLGLAVAGAACGEEGDTTDLNLLDSELVVGTYDFETLAFDVAGPTFGSYDVLQAASLDPTTHFLDIAPNGTAQLAFQNPDTGVLEPANAVYAMLETGVRVEFQDADQPGLLLIPQTLDLLYDGATSRLSFIGQVSVPRDRLVSLVPELEGEPLDDPVPGTLTLVFVPR